MKILKIALPAVINLTVVKGEVLFADLPEIILEIERQLNNLRLEDVKPGIVIGPRFHLLGDLNEYKFKSTGTRSLKRLPTDSKDQ